MFLTEQFKSTNVRFLKAPNGQPVIIAADFVEVLKGNKANTATIVKNNVREKWWIDLPNPKGGKAVRCLFEPGAYQLASNPMFTTEFAEEFQDWLFEVALPKLRASGGYIMPTATSDQLQALQTEIETLKAQRIAAFDEGKQAAAALLPQPERVTNPERHIYKVAVCCLRVLAFNSKAMDSFEIAQRMHQEALDGAFLMQSDYRDTLLQSADNLTINFALQCLQQIDLVDFNGRFAKLKGTKLKATKAMEELLRETGKLYNPLVDNISHWQESINYYHQ